MYAVAWSPDGSRLASAVAGKVRLWDLDASGWTGHFTGHRCQVWTVAWSPDGTRIVSAGNERTARLWDPTTGSEILQLVGHTGYSVYALTWSPDGTRIASAGGDGTVRLWDAATGTQTGELPGDGLFEIRAVAWSPDDRYVAMANEHGAVRIYEHANATLLLDVTVGETCRSLAFDPSGSGIAVGTERAVLVLDIERQQPPEDPASVRARMGL